MTPLTTSLIAGAVQSGLIILLAADRWVHRVTGATSLEARIGAMEKMILDGNERSSKKARELTIYLEERRSEVEAIRAHVHELSGEMTGVKLLVARGGIPDDRRER